MQKQNLQGLAAGLAAASIWGGMYVVSKTALDVIPPFTLLSIRLALGIRENTALTGPVGGNGGKTGASIEWYGVSTKVNGAPQGKLITPSADWQLVEFVPGVDPVLSYTGGNGTLDPGEGCDGGAETSACDGDCTSVVCGDARRNAAAGIV